MSETYMNEPGDERSRDNLMRLVVLESPYQGEVGENVEYAQQCLLDCLERGEAPIASHLLFPAILDDWEPHQRGIGLNAGRAWIRACDAMVVYCDRGVSKGMHQAIGCARIWGKPIEYRRLGPLPELNDGAGINE